MKLMKWFKPKARCAKKKVKANQALKTNNSNTSDSDKRITNRLSMSSAQKEKEEPEEDRECSSVFSRQNHLIDAQKKEIEELKQSLAEEEPASPPVDPCDEKKEFDEAMQMLQETVTGSDEQEDHDIIISSNESSVSIEDSGDSTKEEFDEAMRFLKETASESDENTEILQPDMFQMMVDMKEDADRANIQRLDTQM